MKAIVCLVCSGIGYLLARYLPDGPWAAYVPLLVSYHLFLAYLAITKNQKVGLSMPIGQTVITHSAFLAVLVSLAIGRHYVPFFGVIRIFIPALAPFEATWLFSGEAKKAKGESALASALAAASTPAFASGLEPSTRPAPAPAPDLGGNSPDDYDAFLVYLRAPRRPFRKPGLSLGEEYRLWHADRVKQRP